jgi:hypothetical protein
MARCGGDRRLQVFDFRHIRSDSGAPAAIISLFDCDNLDLAAVHLQSLTDLLSEIKYLPHD